MAYRIKQVDEDFLKSKLKEEKQNSTTKLPKVFNKKPANYSNIKISKFKPWITEQINQHLPDDDIAVDYIYELLQVPEGDDAGDSCPDIYGIHQQVTDFLGEEDSLKFCKQLWKLLLEASKESTGVPKEFQQKEEPKKIIPEESKARKKTNYNRISSNSPRLDSYNSPGYRREYEHNYGSRRDYEHNYVSRSARDRDESHYRLSRGRDLYRTDRRR
ncbi:hypothetical protein Cantr_00839 [Candida viswanathii]|uniref:U1 small nuclear ribonucleoprotein component SNU71 n=1 Tax=Candida viswanathii TaxID=5486 RepID=A0A367YGV9_9ASCO|nr:hypothetical protein Cantr_00839 [Candida viswanathii]